MLSTTLPTNFYSTIYEDLSHFGEKDHERIVLERRNNTQIPVTKAKEHWFRRLIKYITGNHREDKTIEKATLEFFRTHVTLMEGNQKGLSQALLKMTFSCSTDKKQEFASLYEQAVTKEAQKQIEGSTKQTEKGNEEAIRKQAKDSIKQAQETVEDTIEQRNGIIATVNAYAETIVKVAEKKSKELIEAAKVEVSKLKQEEQRLIEEKNRELEELAAKAAQLDEKIESHADTLLACADGTKIYTSSLSLTNIPFFNRDTTPSISEEEKKNHPHLSRQFDLSRYSFKTVRQFLDYLEKPDSLQKVQAHEDWIQLYQLAYEVGDDQLKSILSSQIDKNLTDKNMLSLLSSLSCPPADPLIQKACTWVANNFMEVSSQSDFSAIKHEFLIEILKRDDISIKSEVELFQQVMKWVEANSQNSTEQEIFNQKIKGTSLADHMRFEHFSAQELVALVQNRQLLPSKHINQLIADAALGKTLFRPHRAPVAIPQSNLTIKMLASNQAELGWSENFKEGSKQSPIFSFAGHQWRLNFRQGNPSNLDYGKEKPSSYSSDTRYITEENEYRYFYIDCLTPGVAFTTTISTDKTSFYKWEEGTLRQKVKYHGKKISREIFIEDRKYFYNHGTPRLDSNNRDFSNPKITIKINQ